MPSRLTVNSVDYKNQQLSSTKKTVSGKRGGEGIASELSMSYVTSTQRCLNDSAIGNHNVNNFIKFSSEYGTYNTVQICDDMINRS